MTTTTSSVLSSLLLLAGSALAAAGCSSDPPGPTVPKPYPDAGPPRYDVLAPPPQDIGLPADMSPVRDSRPPDGGAPDATPDATPGCEEPTGVSCPSPCPADQLCVKAMGPRCAKTIELVGPADKQAFVAIAKAYVDCWALDPADDTLCGTFDSCALTELLTEEKVRNWVCNQAGVLDFPDAKTLEKAKSLCACGTLELIDRPDWKTGIEPGKRGKICIWFNVKALIFDDRIDVGYCEDFTL